MIRHQAVSVDRKRCPSFHFTQPIEKYLIVLFIEKSLPSIVAPRDGVVEGSGNVNSRRTRHGGSLLTINLSYLSSLTQRSPLQRERDYSPDTSVSKPIEITDRGILVCYQWRRKHPCGARFAAHVMRKIGKRVVVIER